MKYARMYLAAALAVALLGALPALASASTGFKAMNYAEEYPAEITGSGSGPFYFGVKGTTFECNSPTVSKTLSGPVESMQTSSVSNSKCVLGELKSNGCQLTFRPTTSTIDLGTPGCGPITFGSASCGVITIQPKTDLKAKYTNVGSGATSKVKVGIEATGLSYSIGVEGSCGTGNDGELTGELTLSAYSLSLQENEGLYAYYPGLPVEVSASYEVFNAENYPATVSGSDSAAVDFEFVSGKTAFQVKCPTVSRSGSLSSASSSLVLAPTFSGPPYCESEIGPTEVLTNGCKHALYRTGGLGISCSSESAKIEFKSQTTSCAIRVAPQTASGSISYSNEGTPSAIHAKGAATGFKWTSNFICQIGGIAASGENGVINVDTVLKGVYGV